MNIAIDCRMLGLSGVGVYTESCLVLLLNSPHKFLLLGDEQKLLPLVKGKNNYTIENCRVKPFSPAELFAFPKTTLEKINQCDLYYSTFFNIPGGIKIPVFVTIHDIIFADMPALVSFPGYLARMFFYRRCGRKAYAIFTVSEFSKVRIAYHLENRKKIINASTAVKKQYADFAPGNIAKKKQILFIGNIKKHKGLSLLLDAFQSARRDGLDYELVIVGSKDNFRSGDSKTALRIESLENQGITFTGVIPEAEKQTLLAESALLVHPSFYEGFGTTPLEAMLSGTHVLLSDIPVSVEAYKDFPVTFFKSGDSNDLTSKMMALLHNKEPAVLTLSEPLRRKYSFEKTVSVILEEFSL